MEFPEGLAAMPPGPGLAAVLARLLPDRASLSHRQSCDLTVAFHRQQSWTRAMALAATLETAVRLSADDPTARSEAPHRSSGPLIGILYGCSDRSGALEARFAYDIWVRLPALAKAMCAGRIDERQAGAYCEATREMPDDLAREVVARVLGDRETVTPDEIRDDIARVAIAFDPHHMDALLARALRRRNVSGTRRPDGTGNLTARHMPLEHLASSMGSLNTLVQAARDAGDARPVGQLREEIAHGLLTRTWDGMSDAQIGAALAEQSRATPPPGPDDGPDGGGSAPSGPPGGPDDAGPGDAAPAGDEADDPYGDELDDPDDPGPGDAAPDDAPWGPFDAGTAPTSGAAGSRSRALAAGARPGPAHPGVGIDVRVDLATLLGWDDHPGELVGWGPVIAPLARHLARTYGAGRWQFAVVDGEGYLIAADLLRTRPSGYGRRAARNRATVEIRVDARLLAQLVAHGTGTNFDPVVAEIAERAEAALRRPPPDPTKRFAGAYLRRFVLARSPTCTWIHCHRPSIAGEVDHTVDHARGGLTDEANQWPKCKPHHALKSRFGWQVETTGPYGYDLISHLGTVHPVRLAPTRRPLPDPPQRR